MNVWSSTVYSCITLLIFVLNFVLFFNLFTLVIFMKVDNIVDACVEFCFLKKQFLNLTINMQLILYYCCDQPSSFSQAQRAGYSALPSV